MFNPLDSTCCETDSKWWGCCWSWFAHTQWLLPLNDNQSNTRWNISKESEQNRSHSRTPKTGHLIKVSTCRLSALCWLLLWYNRAIAQVQWCITMYYGTAVESVRQSIEFHDSWLHCQRRGTCLHFQFPVCSLFVHEAMVATSSSSSDTDWLDHRHQLVHVQPSCSPFVGLTFWMCFTVIPDSRCSSRTGVPWARCTIYRRICVLFYLRALVCSEGGIFSKGTSKCSLFGICCLALY